MSLRDRLLQHLRKRFEGRPPPLRLVFSDGSHFDFAPHIAVTIAFHSVRPLKAMIRGNFAALGDAYVTGDLSVEGNIEEILSVGISLAERLGKVAIIRPLSRLAYLVPRHRSKSGDVAKISYHYDVGNEFYKLWLDDRMIYSCAYFRTGVEDIHAAQRQKLDHICRKMMLGPGQQLLDLGCGWGGLLVWAATNYGISGVGVTLSERQYSHAKDLIGALGLGERIEIRFQDYRDIGDEGRFDKIVSVGMYEHVGLENFPLYFAQVTKLLRPGGAFLNHGIVATDPASHARGPAGGEFIDRYIFPGGAVPHLSRVLVELSRAGLEFSDAEDLRPHYALTLQHWSRRLDACRDDAIRAVGPQKFRIWRVFLAAMAHAFDRGWLSISQIMSFKALATGEVIRPWTRDYQYDGTGRTASIPQPRKLQWTGD